MATGSSQAGNYSFAQIESLWLQAGGSAAWAPTMAAVAMAESSGQAGEMNNGDINGGSYGLWQINGSTFGISSNTPPANGGPAPTSAQMDSLLTPIVNAQYAVAKFNSAVAAGESPLTPWQGDQFVKDVGKLTAPLSLSAAIGWVANYIGSGDSSFLNSFLSGATGTPPASVPSQGAPITMNPSAAGQATPGLGVTYPWTALIGDMERLFSDVTNVGWWKRVALGAGGILLFGIGLVIFLSSTKEGEKVTGDLGEAAPVAALAA